MKVGLVLEGGGMRGLFTAGVLDVFLDENIAVNGIVSVSAGALFGVNFPSKQRGRALRYNKKYLGDTRYIGFKNLFTTGNIISKDFAFHEVPVNLDPFDQTAFARSGIDFYVTLTNVETGQAEYIKIKDIFAEMETFRATSAMPFVSKMIEINGQKYLDGGIADSIPLDYAKALGFDKIIVILTRPFDYRKSKSSSLPIKLFYHHYPHLVERLENRYADYNQKVEQIIQQAERQEIFVLRPNQSLKIGRLEKDVSKIQAMYDQGVNVAKENLEALRNYLTC